MHHKRLLTLKQRHEFKHVQNNGKKSIARTLILQAAEQLNIENKNIKTRFGFIVTKKVGNAVVRNRIRRRLKSAASEVISKNGKENYDYILIGRKYSITCGYKELIDDIVSSLKVTGCWKKSKSI